MDGVIALGIVAGYFAVWIGFAVWASRRGWSKIVGIGGGFLAACVAIMVVALIAVTTTEKPLQKMQDQAVGETSIKPTVSVPQKVPQLPHKYYVIQDGAEYGYEQAVSAEAQHQGQVASNILMFKFLGERDGTLQFYNREGDVVVAFQCERPCEYVKQMVFFDQRLQKKQHLRAVEGSILWAVSRDAMNGLLKQYTNERNGKMHEGWFEEAGPKWRPITTSK